LQAVLGNLSAKFKKENSRCSTLSKPARLWIELFLTSAEDSKEKYLVEFWVFKQNDFADLSKASQLSFLHLQDILQDVCNFLHKSPVFLEFFAEQQEGRHSEKELLVLQQIRKGFNLTYYVNQQYFDFES